LSRAARSSSLGLGAFFLLALVLAAPASADHCDPAEGHLCLHDGRFELTLDWRTSDGATSGKGLAVPLSTNSGWFWFFGPANVEAMVKVLDGRAINGNWWVFAGALSDLELELAISDLTTGELRVYRSEAGTPAALRDLEAFADAGTPSIRAAGDARFVRLPSPHHSGKEIDPNAEPIENAYTAARCQSGDASGFPCFNVDLQSLLPLASMTPLDTEQLSGNDVWGWVDPDTKREYVLQGLSDGTAFVDVTEPGAPEVLGHLATETRVSLWRDIKVYRNRAYVVADSALDHGMQVFDLRRLRGRTAGAIVTSFEPDSVYREFGSAHNLAVNEESGFAYAVGSDSCSGGLHMIDVRDPDHPEFAGCFAADGYTHDVQCVTYRGPDGRYFEHEICLASNEDTLTIVDVTNKSAPLMLSRTDYEGRGYTHQGWLTEDSRYFLLDDEGDERNRGVGTTTYIWDVRDLLQPRMFAVHQTTNTAIDHDQMTHRGFVFQANYTSGLRVLDLSNVGEGKLNEVAYFDIVADNDDTVFNGAWAAYPFLPSGNVAVSGILQGLAIVRPLLPGFALPLPPRDLLAKVTGLSVELQWRNADQPQDGVRVYRRRTGFAEELTAELPAGTATFVDRLLEPLSEYRYRVVGVLGAAEGDGPAVTVTTATQPSDCAAGATTHCLLGERFAVSLEWRAPGGEPAPGQVVPLTAESGAFWFFDAANTEVVVKLVDGRAINGHFWVFVGGLSDVEYTLTLTDTANGRTRIYANPAGTLRSFADTSAMPGS
jgi:choice-of-anchor B domain-containing protein